MLLTVILAIIVFVVWAASFLFYDVPVNEDFPAAAPTSAIAVVATAPPTVAVATAAPTVSVAATAAPAVQVQPTALVAPTAVPTVAPEPTLAPTAVPVEPVALFSGSFTYIDALHNAEGQATIYTLPDGQRILRLENFTAQNGPDLFIGLSGHPQPRSNAELMGEGYVELGRLKGNTGNQNYELPADLDISAFKSVTIYCKAFSVMFSSATLQ
ncbi:hypothetical protein HC891_12645 [Candidatus Gracilibacteria bacterium]|nr:hypothetical protein [Candidatus Gracilibacteria bacterium]